MYASCYHLLNFLPGTKFVQRPTCVQWNTMPKNDTSLDIWSTLTTPGWCLDKCVGKNFTYAGVQGALCRCGNASPTFARVNLSECSWECEVERSQRCGGPMEWSVVGPGYPSVPAYCAYEYKYPLVDEFTRSPVPPSPDGGWHGWCIEKCASSGNYSYAGLMKQGECQCFCGARQPAREWVLEESKCENSCDRGVPDHGCGGKDAISVYKLNTTADTEDIAPEEEEPEDDTLSLTTSSSSDVSQITTATSVGKDQLLFSEIHAPAGQILRNYVFELF